MPEHPVQQFLAEVRALEKVEESKKERKKASKSLFDLSRQ